MTSGGAIPSWVYGMYRSELSKAIKGMEEAILSRKKFMYDQYKKEIEDYHKKLSGKGLKLSPLQLPKWGKGSEAKPLAKGIGKVTEKVAGRTGKQIEAAKRAQAKRLGQSGAAGKQKRCKKGKSCGASCIAGFKVCLVDIPWASASGIPKVVSSIQNRPTPEVKPSTPSAKKPGINLSKLETEADFKAKENATEGYYNSKIKDVHQYLKKLLAKIGFPDAYVTFDNSTEEDAFSALRDKLVKAMGNGNETKGRQAIKDARYAIISFTGSFSKEIREAQMGTTPNAQYLKKAKDIERLFSMKEVEKPRVEKFRGKRVDEVTLQGMIESAREGGSYSGRALSSWSTQLRTAREFSDKEPYDNRNQRVIYRTVNTKGVPIKEVSAIQREHEVLTSGTANYKYLGYRPIEVNGIIYHMFDVEES